MADSKRRVNDPGIHVRDDASGKARRRSRARAVMVVPTIGRMQALGRYFRDPSASFFGKAFVALAAAYVVWPLDLLPDVPLVGWLDDLGVASVAMAHLARVAHRYRRLPPREDEAARDDRTLLERTPIL